MLRSDSQQTLNFSLEKKVYKINFITALQTLQEQHKIWADENHMTNTKIKEYYTQKFKFCHPLLFQTCMCFFLLWKVQQNVQDARLKVYNGCQTHKNYIIEVHTTLALYYKSESQMIPVMWWKQFLHAKKKNSIFMGIKLPLRKFLTTKKKMYWDIFRTMKHYN